MGFYLIFYELYSFVIQIKCSKKYSLFFLYVVFITCQTWNSTRASEAPADTEGDLVTAIEEAPSTSVVMSNDQPLLTQASDRLADGLLNTRRTLTFARVREPNPFDSSDTQKLQPFLTQCFLNFQDHPDTFTDDSVKVIYTLSYLKGTGLDWFEPSLTSRNNIPWLSNYSKFVSELCSYFGPFDPEGEAKAELKNVHMHDNQRITKYLVKFNRLAARVQWGNAAP